MSARIIKQMNAMTNCDMKRPTQPHAARCTLGEMLAVVAVVAILAALLDPALCKSREQAKGLTSLNDLRQIGGAPPGLQATGFPSGRWVARL